MLIGNAGDFHVSRQAQAYLERLYSREFQYDILLKSKMRIVRSTVVGAEEEEEMNK